MTKTLTKTVKIYKPRAWTRPLHEGTQRWKVIVAHRRCGKTVSSLNHLIRDAVRGYRSRDERDKLIEEGKYHIDHVGKKVFKPMRFAYVAPTYKQAKNIAWDILKEHAGKVEGVKFNEAELRCDFKNGSRITLFGADNPDSLRGLALWGVVFDEYSQQPSNIFTEIIAPALADHKGYAIWIGTPKGKNSFWDLYNYATNPIDEDGEKASDWKDWKALLLTVDDTHLIDDKELRMQKSIMTDDEYLQEWYCSFEAAIKGSYYAKELSETRQQNRLTMVPYEEQLDIYTFWDLGMNDSTSIIFAQVFGKEIRVIDYYENHGKGLDHYLGILKDKTEKYGYRYCDKSHWFPHDIAVKEFGSGVSREERLRSMGIKVNVVKNISINDGIDAARVLFKKIYFDVDKTGLLVEALSQYRQEWDNKKLTFKDSPLHDWTSHAADSFRYLAVTINNLTKGPEQKEAYIPSRPNFKRR